MGVLLLTVGPVAARYKIRPIKPRPASEYPFRQNFQKIVIAADPHESRARVLELFDTPKVHEKGFLPILVIVENNNGFAIQIDETDIFLVDPQGGRVATVPFEEVLWRISVKKPGTPVPGRREILLKEIDKHMVDDFEHKSFGEKMIAPNSSDHGVIFFPLPEHPISELRLYFPAVYNITDREPLIFFEFGLGGDR